MNGSQMILGLIIGIILLLVLILKTKVHPFLALIISAATIGLIGGMESGEVVSSITSGFGGTLGSIGIIIGFGVMMGQIFEVSGAAERMARTFIKMLGKGKEEIALAITGFVVSIPIFCDSGFVILSPLVKAISRKTRKSAVGLGISLAVGLVVTHSVVPPTPGPVGVAGIFGVSVGSLLLWGIVLAIPMTIVGLIYAKYIGQQLYQLPDEESETGYKRVNAADIKLNYDHIDDNTEKLPSNFIAFGPIVIPIILILVKQLVDFFEVTGGISALFTFIGNPVIAVGIGLIIAILGLTKTISKEETIKEMEKGMKSAGIIIFVTGGGGALGSVLRTSGAGDYIAQLIADSSLPAILLPLIIATLVRFIQGSGTVSMITAASICAPILSTMDVNPVFAALAACVGSVFFGYFNDSYFWVVNRTLGISDTKEQIRAWSITSTLSWATGVVGVLVLNMIFG
ncbi:GntP family permease [Defluviitalea phaphyphila]|uniref:GntP family permease n=1 Tax=Defluviitalea phaphyphila TaxID=1473580 RepID=UPI000730F5D9|nr:gluconate:H+ symporter [Defluviitalea phaphyphila]